MTLLLIAATPAMARQESGEGDFRAQRDVLSAVKAAPLYRIGEDVIRFSATPALGGRGLVVEIHRRDAAWSVGTLTILGGHSDHWETVGTVTLHIRTPEYEALARQVDALMAKGPPQPSSPYAIVLCTDGPGWVTERRVKGRDHWLAGFCGDHPNKAIQKLVADAVHRALDEAMPRDFRRGEEPQR